MSSRLIATGVFLLVFSAQAAIAQSVFINELDSDTPSTDTAEFVELFDGGVGGQPLDGLVVVFYNGATNASYAAFDLDGRLTSASGYFVLGNVLTTRVNLTFPDNTLQNGQDAVALYVGNATDFPTNTPITTTNLIDAVVYGTDDPSDSELAVLLNAGQPQLNEGLSALNSIARCPNGTGGLRNTTSYVVTTPTPGDLNVGDCPVTSPPAKYTTLASPCRIFDTRLAGGALASGTPRHFRVKGSGFDGQGGNDLGCGVPPSAVAAVVNLVAVAPSGSGNLRGSAWPNPVPSTGSIINYQLLTPSLNIANGLPLPLCPGDCAFDITLQPNGSGTHVVGDVVGYFSADSSLAYTTFERPCRIFDTRIGGGSLVPGVPRDFKVAGIDGFEEQGGTPDGCGVPGAAKAAMINFVAVNGQGNGNLRGAAFPNPVPTTGSVINYQQLSPPLNIANGLPFPICDSGASACGADITLQANGAAVDVVADVLGYFSSGFTSPSIPDTQEQIEYSTFSQPCRIIDTRIGGGILTSGTPRSFVVAGSDDFPAQGGNSGGCGIPADATVALINFVAVAAEGNGNLKGSAYPNPIPATGNVINYQALTPPLNIANGVLFPICDSAQSLCQEHITLQANGSNVHVVADVLGYGKSASEPPTDTSDKDGDGYSEVQGDCDDTNPSVHPGAVEVPDNGIDDNCDGNIDEGASACQGNLQSNSANALDFARAMDLCQTTTEGNTQRWGVISASFTRPSGSGAPHANARSIRTSFGNNMPRAGNNMTILSTGNAAAPGQTNPSYIGFQGGAVHNIDSAFPADWYAANGNALPNAPGCPPPSGSTAQDPIMLNVRVRVPTTARSFAVSSRFFSSEYPEWVCSAFNDFFVVLLDSTFSGSPANPADKNLAVFTTPTSAKYPIGVNLAFGNSGLFQACKNGATGCASGAETGNTTSCTGTTDLGGTGFDIANPHSAFPGEPGYCGENNLLGGGTAWLRIQGNVVPGEVINLRFAIWDTGDGFYDSLALLDNFRWSTELVTPGAFIE